MSDRQVAARVDESSNVGGTARGGHRGRWTVIGRLLGSRPVRWGFVAGTVGLGGCAVAREWTHVRASLADLGFLTVAAALASVLLALLATMQVWRLLLA